MRCIVHGALVFFRFHNTTSEATHATGDARGRGERLEVLAQRESTADRTRTRDGTDRDLSSEQEHPYICTSDWTPGSVRTLGGPLACSWAVAGGGVCVKNV